jgi:hypothetical protein
MIKLKNGGQVAPEAIEPVKQALRTLPSYGTLGLLSLVDLIRICRDPDYIIHDQREVNLLVQLGLLDTQSKAPLDSTRDIVCSCYLGQDVRKPQLRDPIA